MNIISQFNEYLVDAQKLEEFGVPAGGLGWFFTLLPATSFIKKYAELVDPNHRLLAIAWDKPTKGGKKVPAKKVYGIYETHARFWEELEKLPHAQRYAYEIVRTKQACRAYWDIEFIISNPEDLGRAGYEVCMIMRDWLAHVREEISQNHSIDAKFCVLEGSRFDEDSKNLKISFHVIAVNVVFEHNQSKAFQNLRKNIRTLYDISQCDLCKDLKFRPLPTDTCAPDLSVWKDNQIFRMISCSKRGGSTPLHFADPLLNETLDPYDSFLTLYNVPVIQETDASDPQEPKPKKRKRKANADQETASKYARHNDSDEEAQDTHEMVEYMLKKYPVAMRSIHNCVQKLLHEWGHTNTKVEKLVRARVNLRYQCLNLENRPCIFTNEIHRNNTPIIWLDAPHSTNEGELAESYLVKYNCKSSECMCHGIIGEIYFSEMHKSFEHRKICPAIIQNSKGPVKAKINPAKAKMAGNSMLSDTGDLQLHSVHREPQNRQSIAEESIDVEMIDAQPVDQPIASPNNGSQSDDEEFDLFADETQSEARRCLNPLNDKIVGYAWSLEELRSYGSHNTYKAVKRQYEKTICKICRPHVMYLSFQNNATPGCLAEFHHYTYDNMAKNLKHVFYLKKNEPQENPVPARFFASWTDDPTSRSYERIEFDPSPDNMFTSKSDLNVWPGMCAESLAPLQDLIRANQDPELQSPTLENLVAPICVHVLNVLADQNQDHCNWILDWMANIIQRPHFKTQVPIVITGKQGVGKGILFDFFREHILGFGISAQIQNPAQDLFSRFANKHVHKIFLQIDEGEGLAKFADQMKNLITADHVNYEIKGIQPMTAKNFINIVITTNHEKPVLVETSDRRYVLFKASDMYLKDENYYFNLGNHLKKKIVARAFYEFLKTRDLSKYASNFQRSRPVTEYYLQVRKASIPVMQRFLSALLNHPRYWKIEDDKRIAEFSITMLFKEFNKFQEAGNFQSNMTQTTFSTKIKNISGITRKSKLGSFLYRLEHETIFAQLQQNHEYDEDCTID